MKRISWGDPADAARPQAYVERVQAWRIVRFSIPLGVFVGWIVLELLLLGALVMMFFWLRNVADITYSNAGGYSVTAATAIDAQNKAEDALRIANEERAVRLDRGVLRRNP